MQRSDDARHTAGTLARKRTPLISRRSKAAAGVRIRRRTSASEFARSGDTLRVGPGVLPRNAGKATAANVGLTSKQIHEASQIRDAEKREPGVVRRTVDAPAAAPPASRGSLSSHGLHPARERWSSIVSTQHLLPRTAAICGPQHLVGRPFNVQDVFPSNRTSNVDVRSWSSHRKCVNRKPL